MRDWAPLHQDEFWQLRLPKILVGLEPLVELMRLDGVGEYRTDSLPEDGRALAVTPEPLQRLELQLNAFQITVVFQGILLVGVFTD